MDFLLSHCCWGWEGEAPMSITRRLASNPLTSSENQFQLLYLWNTTPAEQFTWRRGSSSSGFPPMFGSIVNSPLLSHQFQVVAQMWCLLCQSIPSSCQNCTNRGISSLWYLAATSFRVVNNSTTTFHDCCWPSRKHSFSLSRFLSLSRKRVFPRCDSAIGRQGSTF